MSSCLNKFQPKAYYEKLSEVPADLYWQKGYRLVIFDYDNTISPHGLAGSNAYALEQIANWQELGFAVYVLTNARVERASKISQELPVQVLGNANKPDTAALTKIQKSSGRDKSEMLYCGDQIFTDIYCANRFGIDAVLLKPLNSQEPFYVKIKRVFEKLILKLICKNNYFDNLI